MDDLFLVWVSVGTLLYPVLVTVYALWTSRKLLEKKCPGRSYALEGLKVSWVPPILLALPMGVYSGLQYQGTCPGWMDSGPRPCPLEEYLLNELFWMAMLMFIPGLIGLGITLVIFIWQWVYRKPTASGNLSPSESDPS